MPARPFLLILLLVLSGCVQPGASGGCSRFGVAPATVGSSFWYNGTGDLDGFDVTSHVINRPGSPSDPADWRIGPGVLIGIAIGPARPSRTVDATLQPAYPVTYWRSDSHGLYPWLDESLSTTNLTILALFNRYADNKHGQGHGAVYGGFLGIPPLFLAPLAWGPAPPATMALPENRQYIGEQVAPAGPSGSLAWKAQRENGRCLMVGTGEFVIPASPGGPTKLTVTMAPDVPLPIQWDTTKGKWETHLTLSGWRAGEGPALPMWSPQGLPEPTLARALPTNGFIEDSGVFATRFADADAAARQDLGSLLWFRDHPEATVAYADHTLLFPDSSDDSWFVVWVDPGGNQLSLSIRRTGPDLAPLQVSPTTTHRKYAYVPVEARVTLDEAARLHEEIFGRPPETFNCVLAEGTCSIGTHKETGMSYTGQTRASSGVPGIWLGATVPLLFVEESYDEAVLPEPAPIAPPDAAK